MGTGNATPLTMVLGMLVLMLRWSVVGAWGPEGHDRIFRIAERLLQGKQKDQIRTMMHGDLPDFSNWETKMTQEHPPSEVLHWHRQDPEWKCSKGLGEKGHLKCDGHGAQGGSLFCAMAYFFEHFAHDALLREYPPVKEPINTPKELDVLKGFTGIELTSAHYLRWLAVLIGDQHQPLHWLSEHNYGKNITVVYQNYKYNLLDFWETYIPKHLGPIPTKKSEMESLAAHELERTTPLQLFREWSQDNSKVVCQSVYSRMTVNHADGTRIDNPFHLSEELFQEWVELARSLTLKGGIRLAALLRDILRHRKHKVAHKEEGRAHMHYHSMRNTNNVAINACIGLGIVPLWIFILRWHEKIAGRRMFGFAKHGKS